MRSQYLIIVAIVLLLACNNSSNSPKGMFQLKGSITGVTEGKILLKKVIDGEIKNYDSTQLNKGSFTFSGKVDSPDMVYLQVENHDGVVSFFIENATIEINAHIDSLEKAKVNGSATHDLYVSFQQDFSVYEDKQRMLYGQYMEASGKGDKVLMAQIDSSYEALIEEQNDFLKKYVTKNNASVVSAFITLRVLYYDLKLPELEQITGNFDTTLAQNDYVKILKTRVDILKKVQIGQVAPDFSMLDTNGKEVTLAQFRGKYVMIDFWASWCGPCRSENPNTVEVYNAYKSKGFEILAVSLDESRADWIEAIQKDKLTWAHVSNLKGWDCVTAKNYGVYSIPHTLLLDKNGVIIAKDLRGEELKTKIAEVIKG